VAAIGRRGAKAPERARILDWDCFAAVPVPAPAAYMEAVCTKSGDQTNMREFFSLLMKCVRRTEREQRRISIYILATRVIVALSEQFALSFGHTNNWFSPATLQ
jgi:hypothetical protein